MGDGITVCTLWLNTATEYGPCVEDSPTYDNFQQPWKIFGAYVYVIVCTTITVYCNYWMIIDNYSELSIIIDRRKFRSQTSDNMDRWKAEEGRGREKRKIRREKIRRERVRGQKIQMREKVGKSRNTVFFQSLTIHVCNICLRTNVISRRLHCNVGSRGLRTCLSKYKLSKFIEISESYIKYDVFLFIKPPNPP